MSYTHLSQDERYQIQCCLALGMSVLGIAVLRSLRCSDGPLMPVASDRLPGADDLTPVQARIELMLSLMSDPTR